MIKYDHDYYYNLLKIHAATAQDIVVRRYDFIAKAIPDVGIPDTLIDVLDYGCGVGFMKAMAPVWARVDTFDIMPVPQTGMTKETYDVVTMYDVLEHIPDFQEVQHVLKSACFVAISVPVKPAELPWKGYKHFKPGEHLHYFTDDLITHLFDYMGFDLVLKGTPECPPRQYITSYIFKNRNSLQPRTKQ